MLSPLVLVACYEQKNADTEHKLIVREKSFISKFEKGKKKENRETTAAITILVAEGDSIIASKINRKIFKEVKDILGKADDDNTSTYSDLANGFIAEYDDYLKEDPDYYIAWMATINSKVHYSTPEILSIEITHDVYYGGAHGDFGYTSLLFDPATGNELTISDIITDTLALSKMAEIKFREAFDIPVGKSINSSGYFDFPGDKFVLPANIYLSDEGLHLQYNPYEIGSFADSEKIEIPYAEVNNILSPRLRLIK